MPLANFVMLAPEIIVTLGSLFLLMVGVFQRKENATLLLYGAGGFLLVALGIVLSQLLRSTSEMGMPPSFIGFEGQFVQDTFSMTLKIVVLILSIMALGATRTSIYQDTISRFEYPILVLFSVLGMMMMLSSQGFLTLFMGLELHSFPLYILSSLKRDDARASEAGMKYFLLGALATGILLYGISLIYGATGSFAFDQIHQVLSTTPPSLGVMMGLFFVLGGLVFKISAVPFHMWTPDVYEGTPTSVTTFLATVPKIATYGILIRILMDPFGSLASHWSMVLMALSFASMLVGSFAILNQRNIRRFIAYSTIANGGYSLMGLLMGNNSGVQATLLYIILYSITIFGFFCCLITLRNRGKTVETISDLSGLSTLYPGLTFVMVCFLFSLAGIPPLAGFFGKLYVFNAAIQGNFITLAIVGILTSVVTAGYYLWIIKVMTMDGVNLSNWIPDKSLTGTGKEDRAALSMALVVLALIVIFFITPTPFLDFLLKAADSLLPGGRWS